MAFAATISSSQQVTVQVTGAVDKKGNPAPIDGTPTFESADPTLVTFAADPRDPSGFTGLAVAVGPLTEGVQITVSADAKIGPDIESISETGLVQVTAGQAVGFSTTVGAPEEQP